MDTEYSVDGEEQEEIGQHQHGAEASPSRSSRTPLALADQLRGEGERGEEREGEIDR